MSQQIQQATVATTSPRTVQAPHLVDSPDSSTECPDCGTTAISRSSDGASYCDDCGLVLSAAPIERSEPGWRPYEERRTGPASSVSRESVGTVVGASYGDHDGQILARHNRRLTYSTRSLKDGLREVRDLCTACELSDPTEERASYLYRQAAGDNLLQGRSREGIAGACVYTAARRYGQPVTLTDVAAASPVSETRISSDYRTLLQELGLGLRPPEPAEFIPKIATSADVSFRVQRRARLLLEDVTDNGTHIGQSPSGIVAASLYAAAQMCGTSLTQAEVAEAAGVSTVTISRQYQRIRDN